MQKLDADSSKSSECEIYEHYQSLTLDTICKIGMGLDLNIQKDGKYSKYVRAAKAIIYLPVHISMVLGGKQERTSCLRLEGKELLYRLSEKHYF